MITDIFTEEKGLMSYIIGGVRKKRSRISPGLFQLMSIVEIVAYHSDQQKLHRIKEIKPALLYQSIPFDVRKSSMTLFMAELCSKSIHETEPNPELFRYIYESLASLDRAKDEYTNHHISFMLGLARELGFELQQRRQAEEIYFDLETGQFHQHASQHMHFLNEDESDDLSDFMRQEKNGHYTQLTRSSRRAMLSNLINYFRLHIDHMSDLKSFHVLSEVM